MTRDQRKRRWHIVKCKALCQEYTRQIWIATDTDSGLRRRLARETRMPHCGAQDAGPEDYMHDMCKAELQSSSKC